MLHSRADPLRGREQTQTQTGRGGLEDTDLRHWADKPLWKQHQELVEDQTPGSACEGTNMKCGMK